jgi:hypothetical protein
MRNDNVINAALALAFLAIPATAQTTMGYNRPAKVLNIPPSGIPGTGDAVSCTYYADAMIRISGTDTPAPDNALILPASAHCGRGCPCTAWSCKAAGSICSLLSDRDGLGKTADKRPDST